MENNENELLFVTVRDRDSQGKCMFPISFGARGKYIFPWRQARFSTMLIIFKNTITFMYCVVDENSQIYLQLPTFHIFLTMPVCIVKGHCAWDLKSYIVSKRG